MPRTGKPDIHFGENGRLEFRADLRGGPAATTGCAGHPRHFIRIVFSPVAEPSAAGFAGARARLRCTERQTAVAVQYDSAAGEYGTTRGRKMPGPLQLAPCPGWE